MICPVCGKPMQHGYLNSTDSIRWNPEKKMHTLPSKHDILISGTMFLDGCFAEAFYCPQCRHIALEVKDPVE